jgi:type I restriction enzyme S subunit
MSDDFEMEVVKNDDLDSLGGQRRSQEQSLDVQGEAETSITSSGSRVERQTEQSQAEAEAFRFDEIPHDWSISFVSEVAKGNKGLVDGDWIESKDMDEDGQIQLVQLGHIGQGEFKGQPDRFITREFAEDEGCTILSDGDLLISRMQEPILRSCLLPEFDRDSIMAVDIARLRETEEWNRYFLMYLFNSRPIWRQGIAWASGTTRKRISRKNIEKIRLQKPPLDEQRKIASVLYTIDQAIQKTEAIIKSAERAREGLLENLLSRGLNQNNQLRPQPSQDEELFSDTQIGPIPKNWDVLTVSAVVSDDRPVTYGIVQPGDYIDGGVPLIRGQNYINGWDPLSEFFRVDPDLHEKYSRCVTRPDDVLLCIAGANTGSVNMVPDWIEEANLTQTTARISVDRNVALPEYVHFALSSSIVQRQIRAWTRGSAQPGLNLSRVEKFVIPVPGMDEQEEIVARVKSAGNLLSAEKSLRDRLSRTKKGLMQDLLTGEVRTADKAIEVLDDVEAHG